MSEERDPISSPAHWARLALTSPDPVAPAPSLRAQLPAIIVALAVAGWIILYQLQAYFGLETTSDPYVVAQLAVTWLDGRFLHDNFFGNQLAAHTFLIAPALSPFVLLAGVPGLLVAGGLAAGFSVLALFRLLQALVVPSGPALGWALLAGAMPLSLHTYLDLDYGFHLELLIPALGLWLAYFLLRRRRAAAVAVAVPLLLVKEDATLVVALIAVMIFAEDFLRDSARGTKARVNIPAIAVFALAVVTLPLLLAVIESAQAGQPSNLDRLRTLHSAEVSSIAGVPAFVLKNAGAWLTSPTVKQWLALALAGSFGLALLRPHFLLLGLLTSAVAWLLKDNLLWPARFAPALAFFQLAGALAFASVVQLMRRPGASPAGRIGRWLAVAVGLAAGLRVQWQYLPRIGAAYRLAPVLRATPAEAAVAARVFARYESLRRDGEAVVASPMLFRFAAVRDLHWLRPFGVPPVAPTWILWDRKDRPLPELWAELRVGTGRGPDDYELVAQADQFFLFRAKRNP